MSCEPEELGATGKGCHIGLDKQSLLRWDLAPQESPWFALAQRSDAKRTEELLDRKNASATIYTHVLNKGGRGVQSLADLLGPRQN